MITTIMNLFSKCPFFNDTTSSAESGSSEDFQMKMPSVCGTQHMKIFCFLSVVVLVIAGVMAKHHISVHRNGK
ncbi:MAG: hypothetical protein HN356_15885 [Calditrichaeota bacterium]|jgi:hypothetical protein|nr:hypothetical protein [Calditrichota bacterium]MBT7616777.1 hypothetical protein [Calditrichota bacterium]MBT7788314.1 hypothetical protein [Calditrichota bacterium]